jgi:hypothetical protein
VGGFGIDSETPTIGVFALDASRKAIAPCAGAGSAAASATAHAATIAQASTPA